MAHGRATAAKLPCKTLARIEILTTWKEGAPENSLKNGDDTDGVGQLNEGNMFAEDGDAIVGHQLTLNYVNMWFSRCARFYNLCDMIESMITSCISMISPENRREFTHTRTNSTRILVTLHSATSVVHSVANCIVMLLHVTPSLYYIEYIRYVQYNMIHVVFLRLLQPLSAFTESRVSATNRATLCTLWNSLQYTQCYTVQLGLMPQMFAFTPKN